MPDISIKVATLLNLQPGDIIISEAPYEDTIDEREFKPVTSKNLDKFDATHISIYTGNYIKPFAHSVREGFKLPGVRLTGAWDGRHIVFRFMDPDFSARIAEIARRWAISSTMYDQDKFDKVYPEKFWNDQYKIYKHQFFSIPNVTVSGPAIPYNMARASQQLCDIMRDKNLKNFRAESMLRAVKFASRSESFLGISNGFRCTSFVVSVVQAAALSPVVRKFNVKFSFKPFRGESFESLSKKLLIPGWENTPTGINLQSALDKLDFTDFFPKGFVMDSKYVIPKDIFIALRKTNDWNIVGSFVSFKDQLLFCNTMDQQPVAMQFSKSKPLNLKIKSKHDIQHRTKNELLETFSKMREEDAQLTEQLQQERDVTESILRLGTPPRITGPGSPRAINSLRDQKFSRKLEFI